MIFYNIVSYINNTSEGYFNFKLVSKCIEQRAKTCKLCTVLAM